MFCFVSCLPTPELGTSELNGTRELAFGQGYSVSLDTQDRFQTVR